MAGKSMDVITSLCKRRGFVYHSSEIYGCYNGFWDYGPLGCELKNNIKQAWWDWMVRRREDVVGLDATIIMHPAIWKASGHLDTFSDPMCTCKACKKLMRADQIEDILKEQPKPPKPSNPEGTLMCPYCGGELTEPKPFNLMFRTVVGPVDDANNVAYLRPETAQAIFADFLNVLSTSRQRVPFGIAQMGKSFRNEVTPRNYTFRSREFEQMELEYFIRPDEAVELICGHVKTMADNPSLAVPEKDWGWEVWHQYWVEQRKAWIRRVGLPDSDFTEYIQKKDELAHYARACTDIEYLFPFGMQELEGIAARSDHDLSQHQKHSGKSMDVFDEELKNAAAALDDAAKAAFRAKTVAAWTGHGHTEEEANAFVDGLFEGKYIPHVIEPSSGVDRMMLALLCNAYDEEELTDAKGNKDIRTVMRFSPVVAPVKVAVFPLVKNKPDVYNKAREVFEYLRKRFATFWDESGAIGRRYRRQDEIGTPWCVTVDFQTLEDGTFTVRERDSMQQERMTLQQFRDKVEEALL